MYKLPIEKSKGPWKKGKKTIYHSIRPIAPLLPKEESKEIRESKQLRSKKTIQIQKLKNDIADINDDISILEEDLYDDRIQNGGTLSGKNEHQLEEEIRILSNKKDQLIKQLNKFKERKMKLPIQKSKGPWKKGKSGNLKKRKELENKYLGKRMKTMFGSGKVVSIGEDPRNFIAIVEDKDGYYEEVVLDSKF